MLTVTSNNRLFPNLKHLSFDAQPTVKQALMWIFHCPGLQSFEGYFSTQHKYFHGNGDAWWTMPFETFHQTLQPGLLSGLHSITLRSVTDAQAVLILDACAPLSKLCFPHSTIWYGFLGSLKRHLQTLEHLDLFACGTIDSWMSQWMLTSCPRLTHFASRVLNAHEVVVGLDADKSRADEILLSAQDDEQIKAQLVRQGDSREALDAIIRPFETQDRRSMRPWACTRLQTLTIFIENVHQDWSEQVFGHLAKFTKLRSLNVSLYVLRGREPWGRSLSFLLSDGLEKLASLQNLDSLFFEGVPHDTESLEWIMAQWPDIYFEDRVPWEANLR